MQYVARHKWLLTTILLIIAAFYFSVVGRSYISRALRIRARAFSDVVSGKTTEIAPEVQRQCDVLVKRSGVFQAVGARLCLLSLAMFFFAFWRGESESWLSQCTLIGLIILTLIQFIIV
jgi:hypothetical protein